MLYRLHIIIVPFRPSTAIVYHCESQARMEKETPVSNDCRTSTRASSTAGQASGSNFRQGEGRDGGRGEKMKQGRLPLRPLPPQWTPSRCWDALSGPVIYLSGPCFYPGCDTREERPTLLPIPPVPSPLSSYLPRRKGRGR